jgi:hypothetical protein
LPIPRAEFEKGKLSKSLEERVLTFLTERREEAYTSSEIADALMRPHSEDDVIGAMRDTLFTEQVLHALDRLIAKGAVLCKIVEPSSGRDAYFAKS